MATVLSQGATQVWFRWGRAAETWKVDPFLYQILPENETHFYTRATNVNQNLLKISHYFPKLLSFKLSSKFQKFWYQIDEIGPIFAPILEKFENMTHVYTSFCTEKGVIFIPGGWFWDPFQRHVPG